MLSDLNTRWDTLLSGPFDALRHEIEGQVDRRSRLAPAESPRTFGALCCWEDDGHYHLEMDVPGLRIEEIDLSLDKGHLTIRADRKLPEYGQRAWYDERKYGSFQRTVALTDEVDVNSIDASLADGVLRIALAKRPEAKPQKIAIRSQGAQRLTTG